ncbi:MFS transporter, DHA1 family, arabinose polymer transporter [Celeribacter baekdonensis]|uniref:MFS transporter, DHA1 family, arabinose polymer transporter n=1 Tax=Celeribacter baekdonensis TaxID=875171 RepID=A0A1G7R602_9RHOB|nr:MFS transporter [Celeribacter baekdonensis]SDG06137.1 MFS transporter, DHA1 family, arabinose polymer transporter [Celeribacter baekdonensis]
MPPALIALALGAFGIGVTEFVIMGLLVDVADSLSITIATAGTLISGYALGVVFGAPILTILTARWPHRQVLLLLMGIFILGNLACALAPTYQTLLAARIVTALTHGTFFGVGSVVAQNLVSRERQASAISIVFTGLTLANVLGVPFGTWLGQHTDWRMTFYAVAAIGVVAAVVMAALLPRSHAPTEISDWREDLTVLRRGSVLRGLAMTVLGYAGVFMVFTYIAPLLTRTAGLPEAAVSPILLGFGCGLVFGNVLGGRFADRALGPTVLGSLGVLALVLFGFGFAAQGQVSAIVLTIALGAAGFATVAPLQAWVMAQATGAGQALVASFNIAAFNLGNALGAWVGGSLLAAGFSYGDLPFAAAVFPLAALLLGTISLRRDARVPA